MKGVEPVTVGPSKSSDVHSIGPLVGSMAGLSIWRVERDIFRDGPLPAVAVREKQLLVVVKLLGRLSRELEIRSQHDGVNRAGFLAEAAVDAFHHVDVESGGPASAVVAPRPRLDGDSLRRADCLTQLAGDASFLSARITTQRKLTAKTGRERPLLERIVNCGFRLKEVTHRQDERGNEVYQKDRPDRFLEPP